MSNLNHPYPQNSQDWDEVQFAAINLAETLSLIDDSASAGFFSPEEAGIGKDKIIRWFDQIDDPAEQIKMLIGINEQVYELVTLRRLAAARAH